MATQSATLKQQIEAQLARRIPGALSPAARCEVAKQPLADAGLSALLDGGIPIGAITEVYGNACSGRTSLACSLLSAVTASGSVAAWVDVSDSLDPETAALCGVELERLLWVRCGKDSAEPNAQIHRQPSKQAGSAGRSNKATVGMEIADAIAGPNPVMASSSNKPIGSGGGGSPHPRAESRGMPSAIDALLQRKPYYAAIPERRAHKQIGTPGMPNRDVTAAGNASSSHGSTSHHTASVIARASAFPDGRNAPGKLIPPSEVVPVHGSLFGRQLGREPMPFPHASPYREEQIPTDRQPSRRTKPEQTSTRMRPTAAAGTLHSPAVRSHSSICKDAWTPLDQALRAVDLLLQAGGFHLLVLDLGSVPPHMAWRIPLATWFRFRAGCERSRASLLVISQHPCARASADLTVATESGKIHAIGGKVAAGSEYRLHVEQQRRSAALQAESKIVSFRKPVLPERGIPGQRTWSAASAWGIRA